MTRITITDDGAAGVTIEIRSKDPDRWMRALVEGLRRPTERTDAEQSFVLRNHASKDVAVCEHPQCGCVFVDGTTHSRTLHSDGERCGGCGEAWPCAAKRAAIGSLA